MRINIRYVKGMNRTIDVNKNDKIRDVKMKYGYTFCKFLYDGMILKDDMTIGDIGIEEGDIITIIDNSIGGKVGAIDKGLADPTEKGQVRFSTVIEGPDYLTVDDGINLFGPCKNKKCIAYNKEVCSIFGFGTFDFIKDLKPDSDKCPKCPVCEFSLVNLETCGFKNCKYSYVGTKIDNNDKIIPVNYSHSISDPHNLDYFLTGKSGEYKSVWTKLEITAKPL